MNVLVLAPHPDDEVLGCGGLIHRLAGEGARVCVAVVTRGWEPLFPERQVEQVRREARAAAGVLGVADLRFLDLPVTRLHLMPAHEINAAIGRVIADVDPALLLLPFPGDVHEDHQRVFESALVAVRPGSAPPALRRIWCYETLSETHWRGAGMGPAFEPHVFVDISAHLDAKVEALRCYASQVRPAPHARSLEAVEALARLRGATAGFAAGEGFVVLRDLCPAGVQVVH